VPKAAYRSDFRENTNFCPQRDSNLGPLAQQAGVLPLDHCDLRLELSEVDAAENDFSFHKVVRRNYSGEVGKFRVFLREIFSIFCTPKFPQYFD